MKAPQLFINVTLVLILLGLIPDRGFGVPCTNTVFNNFDSGQGSLRYALANASNGDVITFCPTVTGNITLTNGQLSVTKNVTILGPGPDILAINGNYPSRTNRVFSISLNVTATISGLAITNGYVPDFGGAAIFNDRATVTVSNCLLKGNQGVFGGAIFNAGTLPDATCDILNSAIIGCTGKFGGAIYNSAEGGGRAIAHIYNSTISGNTSVVGGAIYASGGFSGITSTRILNSTFNSNPSTADFGDIYNEARSGGSATLDIGSTILNATTITNYSGTIHSLGYNLTSDSGSGYFNAVGDRTNTNPILGPLQLNGGQTPNHAIPTNSPAIDAGTNFTTFAIDQRGGTRTVNIAATPNAADGTDIGAFEFNPVAPPVVTSPDSTAFITGCSNAFKVVATSNPSFFAASALPAGINLSSSGILGGVPPVGTSGIYLLTIVATNGSPPAATQYFTLTLVEPEVAAARPAFNTNGWGWALNGTAPGISNNVLTLTDGPNVSSRSAWFCIPLYIGGFQASFTYTDIGGGGADGCAFVVQNDSRATAALGFPGSGLGYANITPSVAVMLNIYGGAPGGPGLMLGTNGAAAFSAYQSTAPVNLAAGNPVAVNLRYVNKVLSVNLTDTVASNNYQTNLPVDILSLVGTNSAWVGITGSEGGVLSHQTVSNFNYRPLPTLAINRSGTNSLVFTWPATAYGFTLQSNSDLNNPAGWTLVSGSVTQTNNLTQVTIPVPTATQYYRLLLPASP